VTEWPRHLPVSVIERARKVSALVDVSGISEVAAAKQMRLPVRRVRDLLLIADMVVFEETGILSPRLATLRDVIQLAREL
jgi:hypothetical protein